MTPYQSDYLIERTSSTSGGAASAVLTAGLLMAGLAPSSQFAQQPLDYREYKTHHQPSSFGQLPNMFTGAYDQCDLGFEATLAQFYSKLLAKQEPLGKEFETVLYDNLWDLYVRT
jgi:hypothetical protein